MISLHELTTYLETYLETPLFSDYGPNGLQVEGRSKIEKIATAVTASLSIIERAVQEKYDALLVHHGLFWNGDPYPLEGIKRKKLKLLLENEISLLAYHLPLDAHTQVGNNWKAARDLGWNELQPFSKIGVRGVFSPKDLNLFVAELEAYYGHAAVIAKGGTAEIKSAALISGGAYRELSSAAKAGVDAFITGNFDEPAWFIAEEEGIHFIALGHHATEKIGPRALGRHLIEQFDVAVEFLDSENLF